MNFYISIIIIVSFVAFMLIASILIMLDRNLKAKHSIVNNGLVYYLFMKPFYTIRNELHNKLIWKKITGELSRFKNKENWKNYKLCKEYPFLKRHNVWTGAFCGYGYTWYDDIPEGWQKAFGKELLEDIKKACGGKKKRMENDVRFSTVKEKYGSLRMYASATRRIQLILDKYEYLSRGYCICCGKPARYETEGYISYLCKDCFEAQFKEGDFDYNYKEAEEACRLSNIYGKPDSKNQYTLAGRKDAGLLEDIEKRRKCGEVWNLVKEDEHGVTYKMDIKASYGITVQELWGIE